MLFGFGSGISTQQQLAIEQVKMSGSTLGLTTIASMLS